MAKRKLTLLAGVQSVRIGGRTWHVRELKEAFTPASREAIKEMEVNELCRVHSLTRDNERRWAREAFDQYYDYGPGGSIMIDMGIAKLDYQLFKCQAAEYIDIEKAKWTGAVKIIPRIKDRYKTKREHLIAQMMMRRLTGGEYIAAVDPYDFDKPDGNSALIFKKAKAK